MSEQLPVALASGKRGPEEDPVTTTTTTAKTYYEVLWGIEDHERQTWVDYGDGMAASRDAVVNAGRLLLEFAKSGRKAGLFVNGVHEAGDDFAEEWAAFEAQCAAEPEVEHKIRYSSGSEVIGHCYASNGAEVEKYSWFCSAWCSCGEFRFFDVDPGARRYAVQHHKREVGLIA